VEEVVGTCACKGALVKVEVYALVEEVVVTCTCKGAQVVVENALEEEVVGICSDKEEVVVEGIS
jgi:hypothetical protein